MIVFLQHDHNSEGNESNSDCNRITLYESNSDDDNNLENPEQVNIQLEKKKIDSIHSAKFVNFAFWSV